MSISLAAATWTEYSEGTASSRNRVPLLIIQ